MFEAITNVLTQDPIGCYDVAVSVVIALILACAACNKNTSGMLKALIFLAIPVVLSTSYLHLVERQHKRKHSLCHKELECNIDLGNPKIFRCNVKEDK